MFAMLWGSVLSHGLHIEARSSTNGATLHPEVHTFPFHPGTDTDDKSGVIKDRLPQVPITTWIRLTCSIAVKLTFNFMYSTFYTLSIKNQVSKMTVHFLDGQHTSSRLVLHNSH